MSICPVCLTAVCDLDLHREVNKAERESGIIKSMANHPAGKKRKKK